MDGGSATVERIGDDAVLSVAEFIDAWAEHERQGARLALAARRIERRASGLLTGRCR